MTTMQACVCVRETPTYFAIKPHIEKESMHVSTHEITADEMQQAETIQLTARQKLVVIVHCKCNNT